MRRRAHVSKGNSKLGAVLNVSLPPIETCPGGVPCATGGCYACRCYRRLKDTRRNWDENFKFYQAEPDAYFAQLGAHILVERPDLFRFDVGGDIPDQAYLRGMFDLARQYPETKFLAFTKRHGLDFRGRPRNFAIILSMWPGWGDTRKKLPRAWLNDPKNPDPRIPKDAIKCSGKCESCGICWDLAQLGNDVVLTKI